MEERVAFGRVDAQRSILRVSSIEAMVILADGNLELGPLRGQQAGGRHPSSFAGSAVHLPTAVPGHPDLAIPADRSAAGPESLLVRVAGKARAHLGGGLWFACLRRDAAEGAPDWIDHVSSRGLV